MHPEAKYLTVKDACAIYGFVAGSLANDRSAKRGIPYRKVGKKVLYRVADIERYLEEHRVQTIDSVR